VKAEPTLVAATREVLRSGDPSELERALVGAKIWVFSPAHVSGGFRTPEHVHGSYRVIGFKSFHAADPPGPDQRRKKHLVQIFTDPGGCRTLSVGSIRFHDPRKRR